MTWRLHGFRRALFATSAVEEALSKLRTQQHVWTNKSMQKGRVDPKDATSRANPAWSRRHGSNRTHERKKGLDEGTIWSKIKTMASKGELKGCVDTIQLHNQEKLQLYNLALRHLPSRMAKLLLRNMTQKGCQPDLVTYNTLVHHAGAMKDTKYAQQIVDMMLKQGIKPDIITYSTLCNAYARIGDIEGARGVFATLRSEGMVPDVVCYSSLIKAYSTARKPDAAAMVLEEMERRGVQPNVFTFNSVMSGYARTGKAHKARALLETMKKKNVVPNALTYSHIVNCYAEAQLPHQALAVLEEMQQLGLKANLVVYNSVLKALATVGAHRMSALILGKMKRFNVRPDVMSYSSLLQACARAQRPHAASNVLKVMQEDGIIPNVVTWTTLLNAYGEAGMLQEAHSVIPRMIACGVEPNAMTFTSLMRWYNEGHDLQSVQRTFDEMAAFGLDPGGVGYMILIDAYVDAAQVSEGPSRLSASALSPMLHAEMLFDKYRCKLPDVWVGQGGKKSMAIDLHGYTIWTAQIAFATALQSMEELVKGGSALPKDLQVITGKGLRKSARGRRTIRDVIVSQLHRLNLPVLLTGSNEGCLVVRKTYLSSVLKNMASKKSSRRIDYMSFEV